MQKIQITISTFPPLAGAREHDPAACRATAMDWIGDHRQERGRVKRSGSTGAGALISIAGRRLPVRLCLAGRTKLDRVQYMVY